jgi:hypothetical protein
LPRWPDTDVILTIALASLATSMMMHLVALAGRASSPARGGPAVGEEGLGNRKADPGGPAGDDCHAAIGHDGLPSIP